MQKPLVMGILNLTPDSFSDGGCYRDPKEALERALSLEAAGADLLDIGAESTRPGSSYVSLEEERHRLFPVLEKIIKKLRIPVSIDTRKAEIAEMALDLGASFINDVSAGSDPDMFRCVQKHGANLILMHMKGTPQNMQDSVCYTDAISEIKTFFKTRLEEAQIAGIDEKHIYLDPGIGFGKRPEDNRRILLELEEFTELGHPLVVGLSRKSFLVKALGSNPEHILLGSVAGALVAALRGASILRVHDVAETRKVFDLFL